MLRRASSCLHQRHQGHFNSFLSSKLRPSTILSGSETTTSSNAIYEHATIQRRMYHSSNRQCCNNSDASSAKRVHVSPLRTFIDCRIPVLPLEARTKSLHTTTSLASQFNSISANLNITRRAMSTNKSATDTKNAIAGGGEIINGRIVGAILVSTAIAAYIISPENVEKMRSSKHEYNEVEVEDDIYNRMKDVSDEVRGEITRKILGKELAEMMEAESQTAGNTADVVADVLNSEALQNAIASLITRVLSSEQFQNACQTLLKNLWSDLVNDPETVAQVVALLNTAIKDEKIKTSFKELVLGLLKDDEVYNELTGLVVKLGEDNEILNATKELLTESAHQALNDPEILDHSMEFATDIVGDNVIQRTSGEALRNTVTYAVRPSLSTFLSVFGVALLFFSASALGQARIAAGKATEIDAAASLVAKSFGDSTWKAIVKVLAMPSNGVAAIRSAVTNILLAPFSLAGGLFMSIGQVGNTAMNALCEFLVKVASSPGLIGISLRNSLVSMQGSVAQALHATISYLSSLPRVLLIQTRAGMITLGVNTGSATASAGRMVYSSLALRTAEVLGFCRSGLADGVVRSSTSFDIIFKNMAARGRRQTISLNDATDKIITRLVSAISQLLGRNKTGSPL